MTNLGQRVWRLEQLVQLLQQQIAAMLADIAALKQQQWTPSGGWGTSSGGSGGYYGCITSADLPGGTGGTPTSLAAQTVWQISAGARSNLTGTYTVYNDTGADVPANSQAILAANPDGTYTVVSVACTANP